MGSLGATCVHTLKPDTRDVPSPTWDDERFGMLCTKAENFADVKSWIEKLCSISNDCDYPKMEQKTHSFFVKIQTLEKQNGIKLVEKPQPDRENP